MDDIIEYFQNSVSLDELHVLLTDQKAWESFMDEADLPREEAEMLLKRLRVLEEDLYTQEKNRLQRERFLNEFPQLKQKLEGQIRKLCELADKADEVHRKCTITNIVASYTGAASGVLTLLGLGLAPVTAGISLTLSATGMGLGAASAVTSVSSTIVEHSKMSSLRAEASQVTSAGSDKGMDVAKALGKNIPQIISLTSKCIEGLENIGKNVRAIRMAKAHPRLVARAKRFMTAGQVSVRGGKQVQKAFGGTTLAMTRGARLMGAATAGIFLMMDVASILEESKHLQEGAKAESAEELRQQIKLLESKLKELIQTHERLKKT
ncbi:apolipoprotein L3-like [Suricata suricatta]|uniref:Apolipoprotein L3 n=1 Tax=Suricata suricatta TaxID=37032 RepID=A0A673VEH8_SURSU|nr:apolipoprotein L3-like [Suricata suricatta]